jgi:catechol 2,3-dioxygenase-like lactoylglutathione lyase family enzyme
MDRTARATPGNGTRDSAPPDPTTTRDPGYGLARGIREDAQVITGMHSIIYATDADAARAFFRDVLDMPYVDAHDGWLIFKQPPSELAVHPEAPEADPAGGHELYLMCDDLAATMADLQTRGVEFGSPVREAGFGLLTSIRIPGAGEIGLYQPRHRTAYDL